MKSIPGPLRSSGASASRRRWESSHQTSERQLTSGDNFKDEPAWSPDGSRLAFTAETPSGSELFVIDVDGTDQRQITDCGLG